MNKCPSLKCVTVIFVFFVLGCSQNSDRSIESDISLLEEQLSAIATLASSGLPNEVLLTQYLGFFTEAPVLLPPDREPQQGHEAALAFYVEAFDGITILKVEYQAPSIILDGELAVRRYVGTAEFRIDDQSDTVVVTNRYIDVLKKQPNGEWRIAWHAWVPIEF